jgi:hypothetical protein
MEKAVVEAKKMEYDSEDVRKLRSKRKWLKTILERLALGLNTMDLTYLRTAYTEARS